MEELHKPVYAIRTDLMMLALIVLGVLAVMVMTSCGGSESKETAAVITHANDPCHEDEALVYVPGSHPNRVCVNVEELLDLEQQRLANLTRYYARELFEVNQELVDTQHALAECQEEVPMER